MMTVLLITRSATRDIVISAVNVNIATMELTEHAVRAEMVIPLERVVIVRVLQKRLQVTCSVNAVSFSSVFGKLVGFLSYWSGRLKMLIFAT